MKYFLPRKFSLFAIFAAIILGLFVTQRFADADTIATPTVSVTPASATTATITVTFQQTVPANDIIDIEVYNSSNQKTWQSYTTNGGNSYTATTTQLPAGNYTVSIGLFTPNWASNYAWFQNLSPFTISQNAVSPTATITPSPTSQPTPTIIVTATPTPTSAVSPAASAFPAAYNAWKAAYVVQAQNGTLRVVRPENNSDTVSEGIGYGMLVSYASSDQNTFNGLWKYAQKYLDSKGLMNWQINSSGQVTGSGSATDADEDIAYALLKASSKWPGKGYGTGARQQINAIKTAEVVGSLLNPGDGWGNTTTMNPSYLAPSYYKSFAGFTGDNQWNNIASATSSWLAQSANSSTGLVPDWLNADLSSSNISWDTYQHDFYYDAIRNPIRLLLDYKTTNDVNAATILRKQSTFLSGIGVTKLMSGYSLSGSPLTNYYDTTFRSGYTAASQIDPSSQFAKDMLSNLISTSPSGYFGTSLRVLTLAIIAGQLQ